MKRQGVPSDFLFSDFPLGNPAGKPNDAGVSRADLWSWPSTLLETGVRAAHHRAIAASMAAIVADWKLDFNNIERLPAEEIERRQREFEAQKAIAKQRREDTYG